ncbi:MAG: RDD family protein [Chromatiaceae bacterium]|nr:RDD family protein [Gammaproteobacteria bacterium]MCP5312364.1 RDD family protein [Chromatiaceae bacterium]
MTPDQPVKDAETSWSPNPIEHAVAPGLARRLAAMFYDSWLVAAIILLGATADTFARAGLGLAADYPHYALQAYLVTAPAVFFGWFWTHGGQTLGMRAWRLKLVAETGAPVSWRQSLGRYAAAWLSLFAFGLGYLWVLFDRDGRAWHDRISRTRLVLVRRD